MNATSGRNKVPKSQRQGPVLGGVRRAPRGPVFRLFFAGGYHRFWPAPAGLPLYARIVYYTRVIFPVVMNAVRVPNLLWLLRWCFTIALGVGAVIGVLGILYTAVAGVVGWVS